MGDTSFSVAMIDKVPTPLVGRGFRRVIVQAPGPSDAISPNVATVFVGKRPVAKDGYPLRPGDMVSLDLADVESLWASAGEDSQRLIIVGL